MEPFIVSCGSCQSRIRIRNAKLIGQRVNCPKCGIEVLVASAAPPKIQVGGQDGPQVDSTALTKDGMTGSFNDVARNDDALPESNESSPFSSFDFSEVENVLAQQTKSPTAAEPIAPLSSWHVPERPAERAAPSQEWSSQSTARSRQYLIVGFLGLSGCILAGLLFAFFLKWYVKDDAQASKPTDKKNNVAAASDVSDNDSNLKNGDSSEDGKEMDNGADSTNSAIPESEMQAAAPAAAIQPTQIEIEPATESGKLPNNEPKSAELSQVPAEQQITDSLPAGENPATSSDAAGATADVPPQIAALLKIVGEPETVTDPPKLIVPDKPAVTDNEINTGLNAATLTPIAKLTEAANERQLRALRLTKKTLPEALSIWNNVVGLPTVINPRALAAADYDLNATFDIDIQEATAASAIDQLASILGLKAEAQENRFWVLQAPIADESKLPWSIKIDDLVKNQEEQAWLKETIELFYPGTSSSWSIVDGQLTGKSESLDRLTWFSIARLLENWRMQTGQPPQLTGYRTENLRVPFVMAGNIPELKQQLNEVTATPTTLASLLNRQATSVGLNCLIDWPALEYLPVRLSTPTRAISPQTLRVSVTNSRPLASLLNELDFELGIATLVINEKTLWLTSHFAYRRVPEVFVIPSDGKPIDTYWSQLLRPLTPIDASGISQVILRQTPDGKFVIAKCCWPTLQFE